MESLANVLIDVAALGLYSLAGLAGRSGMGVWLHLPPALGALRPLGVVPHSGIR